jgi:hypothetical protein
VATAAEAAGATDAVGIENGMWAGIGVSAAGLAAVPNPAAGRTAAIDSLMALATLFI